jgi:hypothetical protein
MSADRDDEVRDEVAGMEQGEQEMAERLSELEGDIAEAKDTAADRQDAPEKAPPMDEWDDERGDAGEEGDDGGDPIADDDAVDVAEPEV